MRDGQNGLDALVKFTSPALLAFAVAAASATQALAQASVSQGRSKDAKARQKLDVTLSSTEGYDRDLAPDARSTVGLGGSELAGYSTMLVGAADYSLQRSRVQIRATGTSALRYYRPLEGLLSSYYKSVSHTAGVGVSARLASRTTLLVNQTATYSPSYLYNLFARPTVAGPGDAPLAAPDYAMRGSETQSYGTSMTLTHDVMRRSSFSALAEYQYTETAGQTADRRELNSYGVRGQVSRRLARNTVVTAGYLYRLSEVGRASGATTGQALAEQRIDIGVDYGRALTATRRIALGARVGSSTMRLKESAEGVGATGRHYSRLFGQLTLGYEFRRGWQARAAYLRGVEYVAGLSEPVSRDSVTASIDGSLTRHVNVLASAGYSIGESALNRSSSTFETYTGDARLRYAPTRTFAAYVEYLYYFYDSRGSTPIAPGIPAGLERSGTRVGLTVSVPVLRR